MADRWTGGKRASLAVIVFFFFVSGSLYRRRLMLWPTPEDEGGLISENRFCGSVLCSI